MFVELISRQMGPDQLIKQRHVNRLVAESSGQFLGPALIRLQGDNFDL
jgi:hypothetical protein